MEHCRYGQPTITAGDPRVYCHSSLPFYMHQQELNPNAPPPPPPAYYSAQTGWNAGGGGTTNYAPSTTIRWPRQETLTLLEIRSRLDPCFKEAISSSHKAPLWDEISRIMKDEYGYQRSGRKCKEKMENLYKYYKKTKEGKVGKHDGKHYRFFSQLEALFGDQHALTQSNYSSEYGTPSYTRRDDELGKKESMMAAIEDSIQSHLQKLLVRQDEWGDKILCTIERKDQERVVMEEEWRKYEGARLDQEYEAWANHVARIETRDKSLLAALQNLIRVRSIGCSYRDKEPMVNSKGISNHKECRNWTEAEISSLIHVRTSKECKFQEADGKRLWEEVAFELSLLGYHRSESECKATWEKLCVDFNKTKKVVCSRTSKQVDENGGCLGAMAMNIDGQRPWETL